MPTIFPQSETPFSTNIIINYSDYSIHRMKLEEEEECEVDEIEELKEQQRQIKDQLRKKKQSGVAIGNKQE